MTLAQSNTWGRAQVGTTESPPGSNFVKYWVWFKNRFKKNYEGQPWCGCYAIRRAFAGGLKLPSNFISVIAAQNWGVANKRWLLCNFQAVHTRTIKAGDLIIVGGPGVHIETAEEDAKLDGSVLSNGGNTTPGPGGSQFNGGAVARKTRAAHEIYGRVIVHDLYPKPSKRTKRVKAASKKVEPQYRKEEKSGGLKLWETGARVEKMQQGLGMADADGYYGKSTAKEVRALKKKLKIKGNGDSADVTFLNLVDANSHNKKMPRTLHQGDLGALVRKLQRKLGIKDDGDYGPKTAASVHNLKVRMNLENTDGSIAGTKVWEELLA